jgi:hypothetical protein
MKTSLELVSKLLGELGCFLEHWSVLRGLIHFPSERVL